MESDIASAIVSTVRSLWQSRFSNRSRCGLDSAWPILASCSFKARAWFRVVILITV